MPVFASNQPRSDHVRFALQLGGAIGRAGSGFVWSPYSVASALGLVATGARGATRAELTRLLGADLDGLLAALDGAVRADGAAPEIATATSLWLRDGLPVEPDFEARVRARPEAAVHNADFASDPERVRERINADVAKVTRGLLTGLLGPGAVSSGTQAVLVNALWARLVWAKPFDVRRTRPRPFHTPAGSRSVPMLHQRESFPYAEVDGWRMLTLQGDHGLVLDVLLPPERRGAVVAELPARALERLYRKASRSDVEVALPRFELTHQVELSAALASSGVTSLFTADADLSGISSRPLRVDQVIHQARLRVDEHGAEGAAATAVTMVRAAVMPREPVVFTVDRPFLFVLRRRAAVLFLGAVTDPADPGPAGA